MLALSVTAVVFVPCETISRGSLVLTAGRCLRETTAKTCKSVKETSLVETLRVERDKPHKRETQNMVGEPD